MHSISLRRAIPGTEWAVYRLPNPLPTIGNTPPEEFGSLLLNELAEFQTQTGGMLSCINNKQWKSSRQMKSSLSHARVYVLTQPARVL